MRSEKIYVWDPFVRVSHWSLVVFFILAYSTGDVKGLLHRNIGYIFLLLIILRVIWGFIGSKHALFSDFMYPPRNALAYLKDLAAGKAKYYIGHNPAAAWMILILLSTSLIVCTTGLLACGERKNVAVGIREPITFITSAHADDDGNKEHNGKHNRRGQDERYSGKEDNGNGIWGEIHESLAGFLVFLIVLHVIGVIASSIAHKENLIKSMITGRKDIHVE